MTFSTLQFAVFFIVLIALLKCLNGLTKKKILLFAASVFFYAYWDVRFAMLLLGLAAVNFVVGKYIGSKDCPLKNKKIYLTLIITANLLVLCIFKYFNFFIDNANLLLSSWGFEILHISVILPLGISFFVFELISYQVDVYKLKLEPCSEWLDFFTFVFFFPRLASGPIIRPTDFLPQLNHEIIITRDNIGEGLQIFILGLFKKLVIADNLALFVDYVYDSPEVFSGSTLAIAAVAYSIQIYCDFSGYSDMAIGVAKSMGFALPINFKMPYISLSPTEFWKRWHISLSTWLRDYLYIPLGGNKKGSNRKKLNLMLTMLLGGLWHGANWTFVFWGGLHGLLLVLHKKFIDLTKACSWKNKKIFLFVCWLGTYFSVCFCWIFFRAESFTKAFAIIKGIFTMQIGTFWIYEKVFWIIPIVIAATILKLLYDKYKGTEGYIILPLNRPAGFVSYTAVALAIFFMAADNVSPFIYFQF